MRLTLVLSASGREQVSERVTAFLRTVRVQRVESVSVVSRTEWSWRLTMLSARSVSNRTVSAGVGDILHRLRPKERNKKERNERRRKEI